MARTATDIANMAADFLDADPIGDIETDRSALGKALRRNYIEAVDTVIREFSWNCATPRVQLNELELPTSFHSDETDHQHAFGLPPTYLGVVEINGRPMQEVTHKIEPVEFFDQNGNLSARRLAIFCDLTGPIVVKMKRRIDAADMDPHLAKAVALELAQRCAMKATNSTQKMEQLGKLYREATRGTLGRIGGHQANSRENNAKLPVSHPSTGARARAGSI